MQNFREKGFTLVEFLVALSIICILFSVAIFNYVGFRAKAFDTVTKEDLRRAYYSAIGYFVDHPEGKLTLSDLQKYGFRASPNVNIRVISGRVSNLFLISSYNAPDARPYMTYSQGTNLPGFHNQAWLEPIQGWGPNPMGDPPDSNPVGIYPQQKSPVVESKFLELCNQSTLMDLQEAYKTAQKYFKNNPGGTVTKNILMTYGYMPNEYVNLVIIGASYSNFSMSAIFNIPEATNYTIDSSGNIIHS